MPRYTLPLLGLEISFRTDADHDRIMKAKELVEERFESLNKGGGNISKEKLLSCLALSLADDFLEATSKFKALEDKLGKLVDG